MINKDILGRELKDGDVVVVKGNGGYDNKAKKMEVGVVINDNIKTMTTLSGGRRPTDIFLVENPSIHEFRIKETILDAIKAIKEKNLKEKKARNLTNVKGNQLGGIYISGRNELKIYLGYLNVKEYRNGVFEKEYTGHCYEYIGHIYESGKVYLSRKYELDKIISYGLRSNSFNKNVSIFRKLYEIRPEFDSYDKIEKIDASYTMNTMNFHHKEEILYTYIITRA